jgi:hypothetical protein
MQIEDEISILDGEIERHAAIHGMTRNDFFAVLDRVRPEVAAAMIPLLKRRVHLFKQIWELRFRENDSQNLLLFSRTRY